VTESVSGFVSVVYVYRSSLKMAKTISNFTVIEESFLWS
jgi:hypothetical protein